MLKFLVENKSNHKKLPKFKNLLIILMHNPAWLKNIFINQ